MLPEQRITTTHFVVTIDYRALHIKSLVVLGRVPTGKYGIAAGVLAALLKCSSLSFHAVKAEVVVVVCMFWAL
jgi:hypothetical protein